MASLMGTGSSVLLLVLGFLGHLTIADFFVAVEIASCITLTMSAGDSAVQSTFLKTELMWAW